MKKLGKKELLHARVVALKYAIASLQGAINDCLCQNDAQEQRVLAAIIVLDDLKAETQRLRRES